MQVVRDTSGVRFLLSLDEPEFVSIASLIVMWEEPPVVPYFWPGGRPEGIDEIFEQVNHADVHQSAAYRLDLSEQSIRALLVFLQAARQQVGKVETESITGYPAQVLGGLVADVQSALRAPL